MSAYPIELSAMTLAAAMLEEHDRLRREHEQNRSAEIAASSNVKASLNKVNRVQKKIDETIESYKKSASMDTDWHREFHLLPPTRVREAGLPAQPNLDVMGGGMGNQPRPLSSNTKIVYEQGKKPRVSDD